MQYNYDYVHTYQRWSGQVLKILVYKSSRKFKLLLFQEEFKMKMHIFRKKCIDQI